jgi:acyl-CoA reductase-like NAD-dependent aldehyde dehydrogenase
MTIVRDSFYINGEWVKASSPEIHEVHTSGTGELFATVPSGTVEEANRAVEAAAAAFSDWAPKSAANSSLGSRRSWPNAATRLRS